MIKPNINPPGFNGVQLDFLHDTLLRSWFVTGLIFRFNKNGDWIENDYARIYANGLLE